MHPQIEIEAERVVAAFPPAGRRVLATILFTDLVGATAQAAGLGDQAWIDLLRRHHAAVRRRLAEH